MSPDHCDVCGAELDDSNTLDVYGDADTLVCSRECAETLTAWDASRMVGNLITERLR